MPSRSKSEFAIPDPSLLSSPGALPADEPGTESSEIAGILENNTNKLMAIEGVVMVGEGQDEIARPAIVVGVKQRHQLRALPKSIEGVPVVGWVVGEVDALGRR